MKSENSNNINDSLDTGRYNIHVRAKKGYGQHFLKDHNIAEKIVRNLDLRKSKNVLEIGPGMGILTEYLLKKDIELKVVEIDKESVSFLHDKYENIHDKIISKDILTLDLASVFNDTLLLIGNLPYNISSQIFFHMLSFKEFVPEAVFMIQREVAERIIASPGSKTYGILSVILQTFYKTEIVFHVGPKVFHPPPKVNSSVIRLTKNPVESLPVDENLYKKVIKQAFNQRRKTLRNALRSILPENFDTANSVLNKRAEQLSKEDFLELTKSIEKKSDIH